jgi:hypothetical protein
LTFLPEKAISGIEEEKWIQDQEKSKADER